MRHKSPQADTLGSARGPTSLSRGAKAEEKKSEERRQKGE